MSGSIDLTMVMALLPEILILVLAGLVLAGDLIWSDERKRSLGWLTAGGLALILVICLIFARPGEFFFVKRRFYSRYCHRRDNRENG